MAMKRVLLVDDNPDFLAVSREFLGSCAELEVVAMATSAQEALTLVESAAPTLVITDLVMPGDNGLELTKSVKARWPDLYVIVLTMHDSPPHRSAALAAGADAFVPKASMDTDLLPLILALPQRVS